MDKPRGHFLTVISAQLRKEVAAPHPVLGACRGLDPLTQSCPRFACGGGFSGSGVPSALFLCSTRPCHPLLRLLPEASSAQGLASDCPHCHGLRGPRQCLAGVGTCLSLVPSLGPSRALPPSLLKPAPPLLLHPLSSPPTQFLSLLPGRVSPGMSCACGTLGLQWQNPVIVTDHPACKTQTAHSLCGP